MSGTSHREGGMTDTRRKRQDGARTLEDLRMRCVIDAETGCWLWRGAMSRSGRGQPTTRVWIPDEDGSGKIMTGQRAAWILAGNPLQDGHVVWRHFCTRGDCISPHHGAAGTRQQMHAAIAASGRLRGDPRRAVVNARNRAGMLVPLEIVQRGERMFAAGALQKEVKAALGISHKSAKLIRIGAHPHSTGRDRVVAGASVFAWRAAA